MEWPFPVKGRPATACADTFGRAGSCFGMWRRDEQVAGGLLLLVAVGTVLVKVRESSRNLLAATSLVFPQTWV